MDKNKNKLTKGQLAVKIMAFILAGLMLLATAGTLLFYLFVK